MFNFVELNQLVMRVRKHARWEQIRNKYRQLWQFAKDYARKCRLVYKRMYSI